MSDRDDQTTSEAATEPSRQQHSKASGRTNDIQLDSQIAITKEHVISYADSIHNTWNSLDRTLLPADFYLGALYFMTMSTARLLGVHEVFEKFPESLMRDITARTANLEVAHRLKMERFKEWKRNVAVEEKT